MIAQYFLMGLVAFASTSRSQNATPKAAPLIRDLLDARISDQIPSLFVTEQSATGKQLDTLVVQLSWPSPKAESIEAEWKLQAWLLRSNGETLTPKLQPSLMGVGNGPVTMVTMSFSFVHVPPEELAGVVISVDGKLFVREIAVKKP
jgi:hypothetical protein